MLIKEVNNHKSREESLEKENFILRDELTKLRDSDSKLAFKKDQMVQEKIQSLEKKLKEALESKPES